MSDIVNKLSNYMFSNKNIIQYINIIPIERINSHKNINDGVKNDKCNPNKVDKNNGRYNTDENIDTKVNIDAKQNMYKPRQIDSLFWCFYILKYGYSEYEKNALHNTFFIEKQEKIRIAEGMQEKGTKEQLKICKIKLITEVINNLVNDKTISVKTFFALCAIEKLNVILIDGRKYSECNYSSKENDLITVIHRNSKSLEHYIELDVSIEALTNYRDNYYELDCSKDNKIKAISAYTIAELIDICKKLEISLDIKDNVHENTGSSKLSKKAAIYERLVQNYI